LSRRRQTIERSVTVLHELVTCTLRIRRYELDDAWRIFRGRGRAYGFASSGCDPMRLDSPGSLSHDYPGDRSDAHDTLPPTLLYTADTSGMPRTSVSEIINALNGI